MTFILHIFLIKYHTSKKYFEKKQQFFPYFKKKLFHFMKNNLCPFEITFVLFSDIMLWLLTFLSQKITSYKHNVFIVKKVFLFVVIWVSTQFCFLEHSKCKHSICDVLFIYELYFWAQINMTISDKKRKQLRGMRLKIQND